MRGIQPGILKDQYWAGKLVKEFVAVFKQKTKNK
jgi:hypothetical protein